MILKRHKSRELAMQILSVWDNDGQSDLDLARYLVEDGIDNEEVRQTALEMAQGAWNQREVSDRWTERLAPQWPPKRQPVVDRSVLRLAIWELTAGATPPRVVIDEAIQLAKEYSTDQSPAFINAILDAVLREHRALGSAAAPASPGPGAGSGMGDGTS